MHIAVHDEHTADGASGLHLPRGHGGVVEHAVALAPVGPRMVRAPGEARRHAVREGRRRGVHRRSGAAQRSHHELGTPREPDAAHLLRGEHAGEHAAHVATIVHPQQLVVGRRVRLDELERRSRDREHLEPAAQERVLGRGEAMVRRERQRVAVRWKQAHAALR